MKPTRESEKRGICGVCSAGCWIVATYDGNGRTGTGDEWCKLLKNLVGRVGVEPTAR